MTEAPSVCRMCGDAKKPFTDNVWYCEHCDMTQCGGPARCPTCRVTRGEGYLGVGPGSDVV